jgi:hypothetical protein
MLYRLRLSLADVYCPVGNNSADLNTWLHERQHDGDEWIPRNVVPSKYWRVWEDVAQYYKKITEKIRFAENICHLCNSKLPYLTKYRYQKATIFRQKFAYYLTVIGLEKGIRLRNLFGCNFVFGVDFEMAA